jgi:hypothetical protein
MMDAAALVIIAASALVAILAAVRTGKLLSGVPMVLDLWIAAALLRLATTDTWTAIGSAAALVAIRKLVVIALLGRPRMTRSSCALPTRDAQLPRRLREISRLRGHEA